MTYFQVNERCDGCLACVQNCPARALDHADEGAKRTLSHNMARCARCATCFRVCPQDAVEFGHLLKDRWDQVITLDLILCEVCSQPLHTRNMKDAIGTDPTALAEPLCPRHRARRQAGTIAHPAKRDNAP